MAATTKRLSLEELETWKAKAAALDEAVAWLTGRQNSEELIVLYGILTKRK